MSIPYVAVSLCLLLLFFLVIWRIRLAVYSVRGRWEMGACRTIGSREVQEDDSIITKNEEGLLAVLADGMGQEIGGKIAARAVTDTFGELFQEYRAVEHPFYFFHRAFQSANREILNRMEEGRGSASASAVLLLENILYYGIVGNVKIAVCRNGELIPVGDGHTVDVLAENMYYQGVLTREDALVMLDQKRIYNYLGRDDFREIEIYDEPIRLESGDIVVLMSDGIYEGMEWKRIEDYLLQKKKCRDIARDIVAHIDGDTGEKDNASIILIRVGEQQ